MSTVDLKTNLIHIEVSTEPPAAGIPRQMGPFLRMRVRLDSGTPRPGELTDAVCGLQPKPERIYRTGLWHLGPLGNAVSLLDLEEIRQPSVMPMAV